MNKCVFVWDCVSCLHLDERTMSHNDRRVEYAL